MRISKEREKQIKKYMITPHPMIALQTFYYLMKTSGSIDWNWWLVFSPLWFGVLYNIIIFLIDGIIYMIATRND